jgi:hypothetical protein
MPIPNQVRNDNSDGLRESDVTLVVFAPPRSGSTWVGQICGDVLGHGVVNTHTWLDLPGVPVLAVIRDPRDCVISHWRFRWPQEVEQYGTIPRERAVNLAAFYGQEFLILERWNQTNEPVVLHYEKLRRWPTLVFDALESMLGLPTKKRDRRRILAARSLRSNRRALEPGHVHEGRVGTWKQFVNQDSARLLTWLLGPICRHYGYKEAR